MIAKRHSNFLCMLFETLPKLTAAPFAKGSLKVDRFLGSGSRN